MRARLLVALLLLSWPRSALAEPIVVLLESAPRPGLCDALRIHMADQGTVACELAPETLDAEQGIERAVRAARTHGARISILIARDPTPGMLQMIVVRAQEEPHVVLVDRLPDDLGPDVDRSLAIKAREAYDRVLPEETAVREVDPPSAENAATPRATPVRFRPVVELGGGVVHGPSLLPTAQLWAGVERARSAGAPVWGFVATVAQDGQEEVPQSTLRLRRWRVGAAAYHLWRPRERLSLGLGAAAAARALRAASAGRAETLWGLHGTLELVARVEPVRGWFVSLRPGVGLNTPREKLKERGREAHDARFTSVAVVLSLGWTGP